MKLFLGIVLLLLAGFLSLRHKLDHFEDNLPEEVKEEFTRFREQEEKEFAERQAILQRLTVYRTLRSSIQDGMTLEEMIDSFSQMCKTSVGDPDNLLFETGTFSFTGEKLFYFSLVRQFQFMDEDEYVQLHLDALYIPSPKTALLHCTKWDSFTEGDFFAMVKNSREYRAVKDMPIARVDVRIDET